MRFCPSHYPQGHPCQMAHVLPHRDLVIIPGKRECRISVDGDRFVRSYNQRTAIELSPIRPHAELLTNPSAILEITRASHGPNFLQRYKFVYMSKNDTIYY